MFTSTTVHLATSPATENPEIAILAVAVVIVALVMLFGFLVALLYVARRGGSSPRRERAVEEAMLDAWSEAGRRAEPFPLPRKKDEAAE